MHQHYSSAISIDIGDANCIESIEVWDANNNGQLNIDFQYSLQGHITANPNGTFNVGYKVIGNHDVPEYDVVVSYVTNGTPPTSTTIIGDQLLAATPIQGTNQFESVGHCGGTTATNSGLYLGGNCGSIQIVVTCNICNKTWTKYVPVLISPAGRMFEVIARTEVNGVQVPCHETEVSNGDDVLISVNYNPSEWYSQPDIDVTYSATSATISFLGGPSIGDGSWQRGGYFGVTGLCLMTIDATGEDELGEEGNSYDFTVKP